MITIVSFSGRPNGNSINVSKVIADCFPEQETQIIDFSQVNVEPCNHCKCDCFLPEGECPVQDDVVSIYEKIMESDEVYFVLANYCGYPNAKYFAFNERSSSFFKRRREVMGQYLAKPKKFIVITNSNQDAFKELMKYQVVKDTELKYNIFGSVSFTT